MFILNAEEVYFQQLFIILRGLTRNMILINWQVEERDALTRFLLTNLRVVQTGKRKKP